MQSNPTSPLLFSGEVRHALDDKNRVTIPRRWRAKDAGDEFYLVPDSKKACLRAMPAEEFRAFGDRAAQLPGMTAKDHRTFLRHFYARSQHVVADKQGRLLIPEDYCKEFDLRGEIVLAGVRETFELWNAAEWEKTQNVEQPTYSHWAEQMGI